MKRNDSVRMKKVLFITVYPSPYRVDFFSELGEAGDIDLSVVFLEYPDEQKHRSPEWFRNNYDCFNVIFPKRRINLLGGKTLCPELVSIVKEDYDEIIFGGYSDVAMLPAMAYLKMKKRPYSIEIDGGLVSQEKKIKRNIKRRLLSSASKWYSSGAYSDLYLVHYGADPERIFHYPFSSIREKDIDSLLDCEQYIERKKVLRSKLGIKEEKMILAVGQFVPRKGFDLLLRAALSIDPHIGIYIVGGKTPENWLSFIHGHSLYNIHTIGFLSKETLWDYYRAADLFVLPTRSDVWGLVINEAIANGLPVITTEKCVAGQELVKDGINGHLVPVDDVNALADAINDIYTKDFYAMRQQSLDIAKKYTIENMVEAHLNTLFK